MRSPLANVKTSARVWIATAILGLGLAIPPDCFAQIPAVTAENEAISVSLDNAGRLSVLDKRAGRQWRQDTSMHGRISMAKGSARDIRAVWHDAGLDLDVRMRVHLDEAEPEFTVALAAEGKLKGSLGYPHPFVTAPGTYLVVPMNEGISYPVDDETVEPRWLVAYGGHGICMPFWGATDGQAGYMAIVETPDDAAIHITRANDRLCIAPKWNSQKGEFGYARKLRYVFLDKGGHVAQCKRYRRYAKEAGLLKTLAEKRADNPNVDLLIGAVNVWCWERDALGIVRDLKARGIDRILWSHRESPDVIRTMNEMGGILTSRYDIYQDLMDPKIVREQLRGLHPDWTQAAWPDDIMIDAKGEPRKGWRVKGKDGKMYPCAVLCDRQAVKYAWRECYHLDHPMTRSDSRRGKMELLRTMSEEMKLVTGSETGHDAAVPFVHYFEGMLSLGPYRVPDAGRNMRKIWTDVPDRVARYQLGHNYRLPLWELVYHDCVVAQWYWGDYNNKLPSLWDKRDLFNILYATPPMFMFTREYWQQNRDRFAQSYKDVCTIARAVGYAEMTDHKFLTFDRNAQQTRFANGVVVTVNFGPKPFELPDGTTVRPMDYHVAGR